MEKVICDSAGIETVARILLAGGVAVIPTDTVYGLAAHPDFPRAVERLYTIKGRDEAKPIALLAADEEAVEAFLGADMPAQARELAGRFWPGALTLVLNNAAGTTEGLRVPAHAWTVQLLKRCGGVLRVTSANLSGRMPAVDALGALNAVGLSADALVDDGVSPGGIASTVISVDRDGCMKLLRAGAIDANFDISRQ